MNRLQLRNIFDCFKHCIDKRIIEFKKEKNKQDVIDVQRVKYLEGEIVGVYYSFQSIVVSRDDVIDLKQELDKELKDILFLAIYGVKAP